MSISLDKFPKYGILLFLLNLTQEPVKNKTHWLNWSEKWGARRKRAWLASLFFFLTLGSCLFTKTNVEVPPFGRGFLLLPSNFLLLAPPPHDRLSRADSWCISENHGNLTVCQSGGVQKDAVSLDPITHTNNGGEDRSITVSWQFPYALPRVFE